MTNTLVPGQGTTIDIIDEEQTRRRASGDYAQHGAAAPEHARRLSGGRRSGRRGDSRRRPVIGYLHRGVEKLFENHRYPQLIPWTDRTDYAAAPANNLALCLAIEELCGIDAPAQRGVLPRHLAELSRIASHLLWVGTHALDLGALSMVLYAFRERELILDLFDSFGGARLTTNIMEIGGFSRDIPDGWIDECREFMRGLPVAPAGVR